MNDFQQLREYLGQLVRQFWIERAAKHPDPKPSWLVEWESLPEWDKEVDRWIGERLWVVFRDMLYEYTRRDITDDIAVYYLMEKLRDSK